MKGLRFDLNFRLEGFISALGFGCLRFSLILRVKRLKFGI